MNKNVLYMRISILKCFALVLIINVLACLSGYANCAQQDTTILDIDIDVFYPMPTDSLNRERIEIKRKSDSSIFARHYFKARETETTSFEEIKYFELVTDQDVFAPSNKDMDYTMGVALNWHNSQRDSRFLKYLRYPFDGFITRNLFRFTGKNDANHYIQSFSFSGFTPYDIGSYDVVQNDRPFAAVAMLNSTRVRNIRLSPDTTRLVTGAKVTHEGSFGLMGRIPSNIAQFIQSGIHAGQGAAINDVNYEKTRPIPRGWPNAILGSSTLPVINYSLQFRGTSIWNIAPQSDCFFRRFKLYGEVGPSIDLGTLYTNMSVGGALELGWFDVPTFNRDITVIYDRKGNTPWLDVSAILSWEGAAWAWNSALQGDPFSIVDSPYTIESSDIERFTGFFQYGARVRICGLYITGLMASRSPVTKFKPTRNQEFARISLMVRY